MRASFPALTAALIVLALSLGGASHLLIDHEGPSELRTFGSEAEMRAFIDSHGPARNSDWGLFGNVRDDAVSLEAADHSGTNVQVAGVDEGDMVKTDGEHIYISDGTAVHIVRAHPADQLSNVSIIHPAGDGHISALYLDGDRLTIIRSAGQYYVMDIDWNVERAVEAGTTLSVYNVSDPSAPALEHEAGASGWYTGSRMIDGIAYIVVHNDLWRGGSVATPEVRSAGRSSNVNATDVMYDPSVREVTGFLSLLAVDTSSGESSCLTVVSSASTVMYMSPRSLYLTMPVWSDPGPNGRTTIYRLDVDGLNVTLAAQGSVDGHLISPFCMDERDGLLRVATTSGRSAPSTAVAVLDMDLEQVGVLKGIAPGETMYAARFMGDRLYLVTAIQVDPLFVVDLSDPSAPALRGELKVPGISTYLQMTEHGLLGVGTENGTLKVSLFDVADDGAPREIDTYVFAELSYSDGQWDHHAVLWDDRHDLLSLPLYRWAVASGDWQYASWSALAVLSVTADGIELRGQVEHPGAYVQRSLYIGDHLYSISTSMIKVNALPGLEDEGGLVYRDAILPYGRDGAL